MTEYDFIRAVRKLASDRPRYSNSEAELTKVRELYKEFRGQMGPGDKAQFYPSWAPSKRMPGWIGIHYWDSFMHSRNRLNNSTDETL